MADKSPQDEILELPKLKQQLVHATPGPIGCALGLTKEKEVLLFIDKKLKPKKCLGELKKHKELVETPTLRFGEVRITSDNPDDVKFAINRKEAAGTLMSMMKLVKKAGYKSCTFVEDAELENGSEDDAPESAAPGDAGTLPAAATLAPRLTALVQKIPAAIKADPSRKARLMELANAGGALIKADDYSGALHAIEDLETELDVPAANQQAAPAGPAAAAFAKSKAAWVTVRNQVLSDVDKLRSTLSETYKGSPELGKIEAGYKQIVDAKFKALDGDLAALLDAAVGATDAGSRAEKVKAAQEKIAAYQAFVSAEKALLTELDSNPFVPLAITPILTKTLDTLAAAVK